MPVLIKSTPPMPVPPEVYKAVQEKLNVQADPPAGLIAHFGALVDGSMQMYDIWESEADYERFLENRLRPAIYSVVPEAESAPEATRDVYEVVDHFTAG